MVEAQLNVSRHKSGKPIEKYRRQFRRYIEQGGPELTDYDDFNILVNHLHRDHQNGAVDETDLENLRGDFGDALSTETMQGLALRKPHGYAGDYEIIDRIYQHRVTTQEELKKWDVYYHSQPAAKAVRNRKDYFHYLLDRNLKSAKTPVRVLNIGSGPGRCLAEYLRGRPDADLQIDCIELDPSAIDYAKLQIGEHCGKVRFRQENALRFRPAIRYDFVWAAGIFDYFSDRVFSRLIRRFVEALEYGGELVVGNFSSSNPNQAYMETVSNWPLKYRSPEHLREISVRAGLGEFHQHVVSEPEGVNLFLHVSNLSALNCKKTFN